MKKLVPIFIMLFLALVCKVSLVAQTATPPSSGDGSEGDPYQIATLDNLYWLTQTSGNWYKYFIQTADIDASATSSWDDGFQPIGNTANGWFSGNYNGDGYIISSLTCSHPISTNVGMFGIVGEGSEIKNLTLSGLYVLGNENIGGLAGKASFATISNVTVSGTVSTGSHIGGLIGSATHCTITYCSSSANVTGYQYTGGFIGHSFSNEIRASNCTATSVTGTTYRTGGFIGECENSEIDYCYSTANVVGGADDVGGFIGYNYESTLGSSTISHSYCTSTSVTGAGWSIGGLIGQNHYGQLDYCYSTANGISISNDAALPLFRIMQESLTNIARHTNATHIEILLNQHNEFNKFVVSDNRVGITEDQINSKKAFGIMSMNERAAFLGGTLDISRGENFGSKIMITFPNNNI